MARIGLLMICFVLVAILGCQQSDPAAPEIDTSAELTQVSTGDAKPPEVKPAVTAGPDAKKPNSPKGPSPEDRKPKKDTDDPTPQDQPGDVPTDHPFEPPFGERVEMFLPPERGSVNVQRPTTSVADAPDVALKGFVRVGRQRAVLLIDEEVAFLAEGQKKEGIQVISIEPPLVTLQLGRNRWTVSLFEERK